MTKKNIDKLLEDIENRRLDAEEAKTEAEKAIVNADEEIRKASETKTKLEEAKRKQEEADAAYTDALKAGGYETTDKKEKNNGGFIKGLSLGLAAAVLTTAAWAFANEAKNGNLKLFDNNNNNNNTKPSTSQSDTANPTDSKENEIFVQEPMDEEKLENLAVNFTKYLQDKEINVDSSDILKFVVVANIDRLAEDCPEVIVDCIGDQSKEEFLGDAFKVIGTSMDYNCQIYEKEGRTANMIDFSNAIYDKVGKEQLLLIEEYVEKVALAKGSPETQDKLVADFIEKLYNPTGSFENIEDGVGLASVLAVNDMANHVSYVDGYRQINDKNYNNLINYTTAELYISNIFADMESCYNSYIRSLGK